MRDNLHIYKNTVFDSQEEVLFAYWCQELKEAGYIKAWRKCNTAIPLTPGLKATYIKNIQLKTKIKSITKQHILLRPSEYTPDFEIAWREAGYEQFVNFYGNFYNPKKVIFNHKTALISYIEIKPKFDQNNMERLFVNNQKFIWEFKRVFINLIEPEELFKKTFMPEEAKEHFIYKKKVKGKNKGEWKVNWEPKTLKQFLNK